MNYDNSVFDEINEHSAYWIGFLMADGSIIDSNNSLCLRLGISNRDLSHLLKFKLFLKSKNKITYYGNACYLAIRNSHLCKKLINYGVTPRKSHTAKVCSELEMNRHFWRGVIDGDGCLSINKKGRMSLELVGSNKLLTQFRSFCKFITPFDHKIMKHESVYRTSFSNIQSCIISNFLYENSSIYLTRKYIKYRKFLNKKLKTGVIY